MITGLGAIEEPCSEFSPNGSEILGALVAAAVATDEESPATFENPKGSTNAKFAGSSFGACAEKALAEGAKGSLPTTVKGSLPPPPPKAAEEVVDAANGSLLPHELANGSLRVQVRKEKENNNRRRMHEKINQ